MTRTALSLAAYLAFVPVANAAPETDFPHRDWGKVATLDMTLPDATTCVTRGLARSYARIIPMPAENGTDIDGGPGGGVFGVPADPWVRAKVRQEGDVVTLRMFYRHPVSQKQVEKVVRRLEKHCLKVRSMNPVSGGLR